MGGVGNGISGDVQLDVFSITVKLEPVLTDDLAMREHVEDEEEGTEHRPLGDTL